MKKSKAGLAFNNIAKRMMGEEVPWIELDDKSGWLARLGKLFAGGG